MTWRILGAGEIPVSVISFSKISGGGAGCLAEILGSDPDPQGSVDWDRHETLGKVRASPEDVITKEMYREHQIIYSQDGTFPLLNCDCQPPAGLEWQKSRDHCLVISGKNHLITAVNEVVCRSSQEAVTFLEANREIQKQKGERFSTAGIWTARTGLFLIRMFATAIGYVSLILAHTWNTSDSFLVLSATKKSLKDTTVSVTKIEWQSCGTAWGSAFSVKVTLGNRS